MAMQDSGPIEGAEAVFDHLNGNHADSVLFVAAHAAGSPLVDAELHRADRDGVDLLVRDAAGQRTIRLEPSRPLTSAADLEGELHARLVAARAAQPDGPLTTIERELSREGEIPTRVVSVVAVEDVAPGLRQITFGGLRGHRPLGPDDFFLVIRPRPHLEHLLDEGVTFPQLRELPPDDAPDWAYYTCRRWRPEVGELDVWFVLHDHPGEISGWARRAEPGDRVVLWGPRVAFEPPEDTTELLLVGDETGLGAFAAILEQTSPSIDVTLLIESDHGEPVIAMPARPGAEIRWLDRRGLDRGTGSLLLDAVAELDIEPEGLYAYGAGESRLVTAVRGHLRRDRQIPGAQVQMVGYWRRGA